MPGQTTSCPCAGRRSGQHRPGAPAIDRVPDDLERLEVAGLLAAGNKDRYRAGFHDLFERLRVIGVVGLDHVSAKLLSYPYSMPDRLRREGVDPLAPRVTHDKERHAPAVAVPCNIGTDLEHLGLIGRAEVDVNRNSVGAERNRFFNRADLHLVVRIRVERGTPRKMDEQADVTSVLPVPALDEPLVEHDRVCPSLAHVRNDFCHIQ